MHRQGTRQIPGFGLLAPRDFEGAGVHLGFGCGRRKTRWKRNHFTQFYRPTSREDLDRPLHWHAGNFGRHLP